LGETTASPGVIPPLGKGGGPGFCPGGGVSKGVTPPLGESGGPGFCPGGVSGHRRVVIQVGLREGADRGAIPAVAFGFRVRV
jgi:hypothetical protein